jgi:nitrite reductase/ring-hydroxylating ferredoxin subunit
MKRQLERPGGELLRWSVARYNINVTVRAGFKIRGVKMADIVKVANKADLPPGSGMSVEAGGQAIGLFNCNGEIHALDNVCPHRGGPLGEGYVDCANATVQCPWHGWTFSLHTGVSPVNALAKVQKFDVVVEGDEIKVALD